MPRCGTLCGQVCGCVSVARGLLAVPYSSTVVARHRVPALTSSQKLPRCAPTRDERPAPTSLPRPRPLPRPLPLPLPPPPSSHQLEIIQNGIYSLHPSSCPACLVPLCCGGGGPFIAAGVARRFVLPPALHRPASQNGANRSPRKGQGSPGSVRWSVRPSPPATGTPPRVLILRVQATSMPKTSQSCWVRSRETALRDDEL